MESKIVFHLSKVLSELEAGIAEGVALRVATLINEASSLAVNEKFLTDVQLCDLLQISTSHFYQLKKKHQSTFLVYNVGKAVRYKLSEVESFFKSKTNSDEK